MCLKMNKNVILFVIAQRTWPPVQWSTDDQDPLDDEIFH